MTKKDSDNSSARVTLDTGSYVHWLVVVMLVSAILLVITNFFHIR